VADLVQSAVIPRGIDEMFQQVARYHGVRPTLDKELIDVACRSYFAPEVAPERFTLRT